MYYLYFLLCSVIKSFHTLWITCNKFGHLSYKSYATAEPVEGCIQELGRERSDSGWPDFTDVATVLTYCRLQK